MEVQKPAVQLHVANQVEKKASTPAEALEILKHEPDYDTLISTLRFLQHPGEGFQITSPSPIAAQLVHVLVFETVPNYWEILLPSKKARTSKRKSNDLQLLFLCLKSVTGLNAILLGLKQRIQQSKEAKKAVGGPSIREVLSILLQVLESLLEGSDAIETVWRSIQNSSDAASKQKAIWQEFLGLVGGGKILGLSAEAEDVINDLSVKVDAKPKLWITNGSQYSLWLAQNISYWAISLPPGSESAFKDCASILSKSLRLGHTGELCMMDIPRQIRD